MGRSYSADPQDAEPEPETDQATKQISASELAEVLARVDAKEGRAPAPTAPSAPVAEIDEGRISGARRIVEPRPSDPAVDMVAAPVVPAIVFRGSTPDVAASAQKEEVPMVVEPVPVVPTNGIPRTTWLAIALLVASVVFAVALNLR